MATFANPQPWVVSALADGLVIPAHPLALTEAGRLDEPCQRALTRYYAAAGAGGLAVGVHTTQFEIRNPGIDLYQPVLRCVSETLDQIEAASGARSDPSRRMVRIAGICGHTAQAVREAAAAGSLGYHAGLVSLLALGEANTDALIAHCQAVAEIIPLFGFYPQAAVGGRRLGEGFWRRFAEIPNVVAIKLAPFNRYQTLEAIRGVAGSGRAGQVALYTGNDDNIVVDLLTPYEMPSAQCQVPNGVVRGQGPVVRGMNSSSLATDHWPLTTRIVGGLLGHWAVWTKAAADLFGRVRQVTSGAPSPGGEGGERGPNQQPIPPELLTLAAQVTDCNAALFDVAHNFAGCIAGVQYVLFRQGLIRSIRCLNPREVLSPGQADQIDRVRRDYPHLVDDQFVADHLADWRE